MPSDYDAFAQDFSQTRSQAWAEFDKILPAIKKNNRVLDLGCGNGRFRKFLPEAIVPKGAYFGLDQSEKLLTMARKNFPQDHFFLKNFAQKMPFGSENFDVIVAIASFHHLLSKKHQNDFLSECWRVLKPGGKIFITTWQLPQKYFWQNFWSGRVFSKNWLIPFGKEKHPRFYRKVTEKNLKKLFEKNNFSVILDEKFETRNYICLGEKPLSV